MLCAWEGCDREARKRKLCDKHYLRIKRTGKLAEWPGAQPGRYRPISFTFSDKNREDGSCRADGCNDKAIAQGFCKNHYQVVRNRGLIETNWITRHREANKGLCSVSECQNAARHKGYCGKHYARFLRHGDVNGGKFFRGESNNHLWHRTKDGYIWRYVGKGKSPHASPNGFEYQHRSVMAEMLGRPLKKGETVHHINGKRDDNLPENLELWVIKQPRGQRAQDLVFWAREIITEYGDLVDRMLI